MHQEYINQFNKIWDKYFPDTNFVVEVSQVNDTNGVTSINLKYNDENEYLVRYAYNHLDYKEGVSFYKVNRDTKLKKLLLPKDGNYIDNSYGYSQEEIERFIQDIYKEIKTTANTVYSK